MCNYWKVTLTVHHPVLLATGQLPYVDLPCAHIILWFFAVTGTPYTPAQIIRLPFWDSRTAQYPAF
jgi:hypothetical protein